jgi:hypothetical protein
MRWQNLWLLLGGRQASRKLNLTEVEPQRGWWREPRFVLSVAFHVTVRGGCSAQYNLGLGLETINRDIIDTVSTGYRFRACGYTPIMVDDTNTSSGWQYDESWFIFSP